MTEMRQKMIEDMQLRGLSKGTQKAYVSQVHQLAAYYHISPANLNEKQVRQYILYIQNERKLSASTCRVATAALQFFYQYTVPQKWRLFDYVRIRQEKKLPVVLSREEVKKILSCVKSERQRVCLTTIYSCGLRISEGQQLQVNQIDSAYRRLHIRDAKGNKERYVPLAEVTLGLLRRYWASHRHPQWLFPQQARKGVIASRPVTTPTISQTFKVALKESGIKKLATVHTLRHSWATHMLEAGAHITFIQKALGHRYITSTAIYLHLTEEATATGQQLLNELMSDWS